MRQMPDPTSPAHPVRFLDLRAQYESIAPEIDAAMAGVIRDSSYVGGRPVAAFEAAFGAYQRARHVIGVGNGTDALEIALEALDLPPGSDVLVPAFTFVATSEAVTRTGHRVVFADVDPATYTITAETAAKACTPNTRALMAVHLYGHPCEMDGLRRFATERGIRIIEDGAQAHGAEHGGRRVGTLGDLGTFSFYPGKNLGAYGDGGAVVTDDPALAKRIRMIANHGRVEKYDHVFEGRCSRLDGLQAAILEVKLRHLDGWLERRRAVAAHYRTALAGVGDLVLPVEAEGARHVYHLFVVRTAKREALQAHLKTTGVESGIHYPIALPKLRAYDYLGMKDAPFAAHRIDGEVLSLPMGEHLSDGDVARVIEGVRTFFQG
jgi:dTDP-4-amino-4,6-dideoxygalactose transaminase